MLCPVSFPQRNDVEIIRKLDTSGDALISCPASPGGASFQCGRERFLTMEGILSFSRYLS